MVLGHSLSPEHRHLIGLLLAGPLWLVGGCILLYRHTDYFATLKVGRPIWRVKQTSSLDVRTVSVALGKFRILTRYFGVGFCHVTGDS